jgi:hypothetical protein
MTISAVTFDFVVIPQDLKSNTLNINLRGMLWGTIKESWMH